MSSQDNKKYYWLKLQDDFFKRHDIRIVENMPNGKDYIIFYLKLLCESTSHEGRLRFSEEIPYNDEMLATITNTNVDVVRSAIKILNELKMLELLDDGTLYMHQINKMIGSETGSAIRKRDYRDSQKKLIGTNGGQCPLEIDIDIEIDKEIDSCCRRYIEAGYPKAVIDVANEIIKNENLKEFNENIYGEVIKIVEDDEIINADAYFHTLAKRKGWLNDNWAKH